MTIDFSSDAGRRVRERLGSEEIIWLTTVTDADAPQPSPVWFLWRDDGTALIFSEPGAAKVRAIRANPAVSLSLNSDAHGGDIGIFTGEASLDDSGLRADAVPEYIEKYRQGIASLGYDAAQMSDTFSQAIVVRPTKLRAW